jgi:hypothetical protein
VVGVSGRDANQLAADVRAMNLEACKGKIRDADTKQTVSAEAVVGLVGTLQQERDSERRWCKHWAKRFEDAEAARDVLVVANDQLLGRVQAAEAALAEAREMVANLCTRPGTCLADTGGDTGGEIQAEIDRIEADPQGSYEEKAGAVAALRWVLAGCEGHVEV